MTTPTKPNTQGGARKGAGRPKLPASKRKTGRYDWRLHPSICRKYDAMCKKAGMSGPELFARWVEREAGK